MEAVWASLLKVAPANDGICLLEVINLFPPCLVTHENCKARCRGDVLRKECTELV
jgi:hypothetical protein